MAYVVLVHLPYLLKSIEAFNAIEIYYTVWVQLNLIEFMDKIREILVKSSGNLYALMNILILHFCRVIKSIFHKIKSKLLFYLHALHAFINLDYKLLLNDIKLFIEKLLELKQLLDKYISTLDKVKLLLITLKTLVSKIPILRTIMPLIGPFNKLFNKIVSKCKYICSFSEKINGIVRLLNQISTGSINVDSSSNIIITWKEVSDNRLSVSIKKIDGSKDMAIKNLVEPIKKLLEKIEKDDLKVSEEIMSILQQLLKPETIDLVKLYKLIAQIQSKYLKILVSSHLLYCTIKFHNEVRRNVSDLFKSLKFQSRNAAEFFSSCCKVEEYISNVSDKIDDCIKKLVKASNGWKSIGIPKELKELFKTFIGIIFLMKFYVDLMAREILIFKNIIHNLIQMTVSSAIVDVLKSEIAKNFSSIDKAIPALIVVHEYLKAFYLIQLENALLIFGLSNALVFSESVHQYYGVLVINLYLINRLIWVIECYISHLIVFFYVTKSLNSLIEEIGGLGEIIDQISNVETSMSTITNKLDLIKKSITELNNIQSGMDITNWKESAGKIREETQSLNTNVSDINSELQNIKKNRDSLLKSWATLLSLESLLKGLILQVDQEIKKIKPKILRTGVLSLYLNVDIMSIVGGCNEQLIFIFWYLVDMWANLLKLIKVVETTIAFIIVEREWLKLLTDDIKSHIEKINKGVVELECAIEGVPRNFIRCSLQSLTNHTGVTIIKDKGVLQVDNQVITNYSVSNVGDYQVVVNRMLEFWTFSEESVKLFRCFLWCPCRLDFESQYKGQTPSTFPYGLPSIRASDVNPVYELRRDTMAENLGNHLCLCLVIKYHLRPALLKCILFLRNEELGPLDTISRKYEGYNKFTFGSSDLWRVCSLLVRIIYELTSFLRNRYLIHVRNICMCSFYDEKYYNYFVSVILLISSLVENIWTMDTQSVRLSIESISLLYSQLESYDLNSKSLKPICNNGIYALLVNKECQPKGPGKCCCCWCLSAYNLALILIFLCLQFKLCKAVCNKKRNVCDTVKKCFKVEECKCTCAQKGNSACCLLKLALCAQAPSGKEGGCQDLEKALQQCCTECTAGKNGCCCKTLEAKIKDGLCKILLLGCGCNCTEGAPASECKVKCLLFENMDGCRFVAVVIFCKCNTPATKDCCCLTELVEKLKSQSLDKICEEECICDKLKGLCENICGPECAAKCKQDCVCKTLKDSISKICGNNNDCLCKQIAKLKDCFTKCAEGKCECKNKGCCKVLGMSLKILSRACRANVLEPYKRISIDLMSASRDKGELVKRIVNTINNGTVNKAYLCKNNLLTLKYDISYRGVKDASATNWGYDTGYEHEVTDDNRVINSHDCPNLISNSNNKNNLTKLSYFSILLSSSVDRNFSLVSSSCLDISSCRCLQIGIFEPSRTIKFASEPVDILSLISVITSLDSLITLNT